MGLRTKCDGCGRTVTGIVSGLKEVNGKYLCSSCQSNPTGTAEFYCTSCSSYFAYPGKKGNGWIELILYFFYIIPGIIYSVWRRKESSKVCPKCKSTAVISASAGTHVKCPECAELVLREARKCKHCGCTLVPQ